LAATLRLLRRLDLRLLGAFLPLRDFDLRFLVTFFTDFLPRRLDFERERDRERRLLERDLERDRERDRERDLERDRDLVNLSLNAVPFLTRAFAFTPRFKASLSCRGETFFVRAFDLR